MWGSSGGLLLLWRNPVKITVEGKSKNFIDVKMGSEADEGWRFTGFYGESRWEDKHLSWGYIRGLYHQDRLPWVIAGDFNEIMYSHEKEGGAPRPVNMMQNFRDALVECELEDMGFVGDQYTWRRRRLRERLDRAVSNGQFHQLFPHAKVTNTEHSKSDHMPILLDTKGDVMGDSFRSKIKQFEVRWLQEDDVV